MRYIFAVGVALALTGGALAGNATETRFVTLAPGHFHAALVQKEMLPGVSSSVTVYAPLGFDLTEHMKRVVGFNTRPLSPTTWGLTVHAAPDFLKLFRHEKPGAVVVISGRNAGKIDLIETAVDAGMNVLVDKPWVIEAADYPRLSRVLEKARKKGVIAYDIMTERFEPTNALQRALVNAPEVFGSLLQGTAEDPGVYIENAHHFMKTVAGRPNLRPVWFFDSRQQGEGMADTGTHLVDLVQWTLAPEQILTPSKDLEVVGARRWATTIDLAQFHSVTGTEGDYPQFLSNDVKDGKLSVFANTQVTYKLKGAFVSMASLWHWQAPPGAGDWHYAVYRGTQSWIEIRQGSQQLYQPELYVVPAPGVHLSALERALGARLAALSEAFPGVGLQREGSAFHVKIPAALRTGHESHFSQVTRAFLQYLRAPKTLPLWESADVLTKYWVTTQATKLSRLSPPLGAWKAKAPQ